MTFELRDGQGTLFKNDKKGNEKAPDYRGEAKIAGAAWKVSGWIRKSAKSGNAWMSLQLEPQSDEQRKPAFNPDEDIPF